jgi:hypothetical protein
LASNPLAILGTLSNGLGDRWHITDGTEKIRQNLLAVAYRGRHSAICQWSAKPLREVPQSAN